jgi:hypothetical protein
MVHKGITHKGRGHKAGVGLTWYALRLAVGEVGAKDGGAAQVNVADLVL